MFTKDFAKSR